MPNPSLSALVDAFTAGSINTALWNNITAGAATLDAVNDQVLLQQPTTNGATSTFGSTALWDATGSAVYGQVGVVPNGNGGTHTIFKLQVDSNNNIAMRVVGGIFRLTVLTAGTTVTTTLPAYDPHVHRWWRLRESGGTFFAETAPDGLTWTTLASSAYSWSVTAMQFLFQTNAFTTEASGNVATIGHINTGAGGLLNPNWPLAETAWGPYWTCNGGEVPPDRYVDIGGRTLGSVTAGRGKQYELDQVQAGTATLALSNTDGGLDPTNTAGPYAGRILPFQPIRRRLQWPPTINLLTQVQATGGDLGGVALGAIDTSDSGPRILTETDTSGGAFAASSSAWLGGTVASFAVPATATATQWICYTAQPAVRPGQTYTVQLRVRNITPSTSVQVTAGFRTRTATDAAATTVVGTTTTLTGSATAGWTPITVTATAGATSADMRLGVQVVTAPGAACTVQVDGWQLEKGAAASPWVCPGAWSSMHAGFVERWPSQWQSGGTYGIVQPSTVDAFALLSQQKLDDPLTMEIASNSPRFLFKLDDPQGSTSFADSTGNYGPAPILAGKYGAGSVTAGNQIAATDPINGVYTGSSGTVVTVNNPNPGTSIIGPASFIALTKAGIKGPVDTGKGWMRIIAFRYTGPKPTSLAYLWDASEAKRPASSYVNLAIGSDGYLFWDQSGPGATYRLNFAPVDVTDGNWHLAMFGHDPTSVYAVTSIDNQNVAYGIPATAAAVNVVADSVGNWADVTNGGGTAWNFKGDIAFVGEFPATLGSTAFGNIYQAWRNACAGESTSARYARILRYAGYSGPTSLQAGLTTSMGPADFAGRDAVSALQGVVDTEGGAHFVDGAGKITLRSRAARYNATAPQYVFGERTDLGEWPYEDCQPDYDTTHLGNVVEVTQEATSQQFTAKDATSIAAYFPRTLTRTINSSSALECQDAANYLLSRYKQPVTRVSALRLHPSAYPALWSVCLALEPGARIRVMRRPLGAPAIQMEVFVEKLDWTQDDGGEAFLTLQCSPADLTPYALFAAWHTTLKLAASAGASSVTVNASQDTVNPLATQLAAGQQLVLGQGTANQETVTVQSVGATSPGWTQAVITLTAPTTKSHAINDVVCEPLPAGVTDPTTYDAASAFDASAFAY